MSVEEAAAYCIEDQFKGQTTELGSAARIYLKKEAERAHKSYSDNLRMGNISEAFNDAKQSMANYQVIRDYGNALQMAKHARDLANRHGIKNDLDKIIKNLEFKNRIAYWINPFLRIPVAASVLSIFAGLLFLSPKLTGNVISVLSNFSSNLFGALLLILGLVGLFFCWRKR